MAISALTISGSFSSMPDGGPETIAPPAWSNSAAQGPAGPQVVGSSGVTLTAPAGKVGVLLTMPAGNSTLVTLKGVTGDTGVQLHPTFPTAVALASGQASIFLVASTNVNVTVDWF